MGKSLGKVFGKTGVGQIFGGSSINRKDLAASEAAGYQRAAADTAKAAEDKRLADEKAAGDADAEKNRLAELEESRRSAISNYLAAEGEEGKSRRRFLVGAK